MLIFLEFSLEMLTKQPISGTDNFGFRRNYRPHCNKKVIVASVFAFDPLCFFSNLKENSSVLCFDHHSRNQAPTQASHNDSGFKASKKIKQTHKPKPKKFKENPAIHAIYGRKPPRIQREIWVFYFLFFPSFSTEPMVSGKRIVSTL